MRKMLFVCQFYLVSAPLAKTPCRPLTCAIKGENGCFLKRRWIKSAGSMRFMVFHEYETFSVGVFETFLHFPSEMQFLIHPNGHGSQEGRKSLRSVRDVRL